MPLFRRRPVQRRADGRFDVRLGPRERELMASVAEQVRSLLEDDPDDPSLRRLAPPAYVDDPFRDAEYQVIVGDQLRNSRRAAYDVLISTSQSTVLTEDELSAWMRAVNDVRLVLGTRLDVSEEDEGVLDLDPSDPHDQQMLVYHLLGAILALLVDALADG